MFPFKFLQGIVYNPQPQDPQPFNELPEGLINDYFENGINTLGYRPYQIQIGHRVFQSDICHRSYVEWRHLIDINPGNMTYHLFAVLRPEDDYRESEVIYLHGGVDIFPIFVLEDIYRDFLFEFIMIPNE